MKPIDETVQVETTMANGEPCEIIIEKQTETSTLLNAEFANNQNTVVQGIFNIMLKDAFRDTHL